MELVMAYLYSRVPVQTEKINSLTFHSLLDNGWYHDRRKSKKFKMLNKRFLVNEQWYRVLIRFEFKGMWNGEENYELSLPCPFVVTECQPIGDDVWKDTKTYHGPRLKNISGFISEGIPLELIDQIYSDLKEHIQYNIY